MPKYEIHDNGGRPFTVKVSGKNVELYLTGENRPKKVWENVKKVFV